MINPFSLYDPTNTRIDNTISSVKLIFWRFFSVVSDGLSSETAERKTTQSSKLQDDLSVLRWKSILRPSVQCCGSNLVCALIILNTHEFLNQHRPMQTFFSKYIWWARGSFFIIYMQCECFACTVCGSISLWVDTAGPYWSRDYLRGLQTWSGCNQPDLRQTDHRTYIGPTRVTWAWLNQGSGRTNGCQLVASSLSDQGRMMPQRAGVFVESI